MASKIYNRNNMSKSEVRKMQNALINSGYNVGKSGADGIWGKNTSAALSAYKKATGGSNSYGNTVGNETFRKLYKTGSSGGTPSGGSPSRGTSSGGFGLGIVGNLAGGLVNNKNNVIQGYYNALSSGRINPIGYDSLKPDQRIQDQWDAALNGIQRSYDTSMGQLSNVYNQGVNQANQAASDAARQQYIAYRQNKNKLAEQLSSGGITGGASETALNSILNAYSSGLARNDAALQEALAQLGSQYQGNLADLMSQLQARQSSIDERYGQMQMEDLKNQREQLLNSELSALQTYLQQQQQNKVNAWNNRVSSNIQARNPNYVWTDSDGRLHYNNSSAAAAAAKAMGYTVTDNRKNKNKNNSSSNKRSKSYSTSKKNNSVDYSSVWGNANKSNTTTSSGYKSMKKYKSYKGV